jgi:DNA repair protein RecN (Recombination protein N)
MLVNLRIHNFITIKEFDSEFFNGLSVFTGESGAGKSVIFSALYCILAKPMSLNVIRPGCSYCELEAEFNISALNNSFLNDLTDNDDTLIIYRKLLTNKKSVIKINSQTITQKVLKEVSSHLAIFINQHEQLALLKPSYQLELIDKLDTKISEQKIKYSNIYKTYLGIKIKIANLNETFTNPQQLDFFRYQYNDISEHTFNKNEELELKQEKKDLLLKQKEIKNLNEISSGLDLSMTQLTHISSLMSQLESIDEIAKKDIENVVEKVADLSFMIASSSTPTAHMESYIDKIQDRLNLIFTYCSKYKKLNLDQLCEFEKDLKKNIASSETFEAELVQLNTKLRTTLDNLLLEADKLTQLRHSQCKEIQTIIEDILKRLGFNHVSFKISLDKLDTFLVSGNDLITFKICINKGAELKPINESASGGELSRVLLAFYSAFSENTEKKLFLFDEIDTGVGGISANAIGKELSSIAMHQQVFCITHLAQIASLADKHLAVSKKTLRNETITQIDYLENDDNIEIVRMMGGKSFLKAVNKT